MKNIYTDKRYVHIIHVLYLGVVETFITIYLLNLHPAIKKKKIVNKSYSSIECCVDCEFVHTNMINQKY